MIFLMTRVGWAKAKPCPTKILFHYRHTIALGALRFAQPTAMTDAEIRVADLDIDTSEMEA